MLTIFRVSNISSAPPDIWTVGLLEWTNRGLRITSEYRFAYTPHLASESGKKGGCDQSRALNTKQQPICNPNASRSTQSAPGCRGYHCAGRDLRAAVSEGFDPDYENYHMLHKFGTWQYIVDDVKPTKCLQALQLCPVADRILTSSSERIRFSMEVKQYGDCHA